MKTSDCRHSPPHLSAIVRVLLLTCVALSTGDAVADVTSSKAEKEKKKDKDDKKSPPEFVPEARDGNAVFVAGGTVQIELTAAVATVKQVEFIIRTPPQNGTLSAIKPHPRETNKGVVTYTHRGVDGPLADKFTFACRVDGGPVSAPATITLTGKKFEPQLVVEDVVAMSKVFLGGEGVIRFTLKNTGPAPFDSDVAWPVPWRGPPHISLKPGESAPFAVAFKPERAGVSRSEVFLQPGVDTSKLSLYGECSRALTIVPGELVLTLNPETGAREGVITLANGRNEPLAVKLRVPERIEGAASSLEVPANSRTRLSLRLAPQDVATFKGELVIESYDGSEKVNVVSVAKPAELRVASPAGSPVSLGKVVAGTQARVELRVRNVGGATAIAQAQAFAPFSVSPAGQAVRIEPGGETTFAVSGRPESVGRVTGELIIGGGRTDLVVPLLMEGREKTEVKMQAAGAGNATSSGTPAANKSPDSSSNVRPGSGLRPEIKAYFASTGLPPAEPINTFLEPVNELTILDRRKDAITVAWKKPSVAPAGWVLEVASLVRAAEGGTYVKVWSPMKNWDLVDAGPERVGVRIHSLPAAAQFEIRIMSKDREGKLSLPGAFTLTTAVPEPLPAWFWIALIASALGVVLYVLLRARNGDLPWSRTRSATAV